MEFRARLLGYLLLRSGCLLSILSGYLFSERSLFSLIGVITDHFHLGLDLDLDLLLLLVTVERRVLVQ